LQVLVVLWQNEPNNFLALAVEKHELAQHVTVPNHSDLAERVQTEVLPLDGGWWLLRNLLDVKGSNLLGLIAAIRHEYQWVVTSFLAEKFDHSIDLHGLGSLTWPYVFGRDFIELSVVMSVHVFLEQVCD
jgi:hypothetical protein